METETERMARIAQELCKRERGDLRGLLTLPCGGDLDTENAPDFSTSDRGWSPPSGKRLGAQSMTICPKNAPIEHKELSRKLYWQRLNVRKHIL